MIVLKFLIETSIYSIFVFFALLTFKRIFKDKLSPALHYGIWILLILRLIIPFTMETNIHFINLPAQKTVDTANNSQPIDNFDKVEFPTWQTRDNVTYEVNGETEEVQRESLIDDNGVKAVGDTVSKKKFMVTLPMILVAVWLSGVVVSVSYTVLVNIKMRKKIRQSYVKTPMEIKKAFLECKNRLRIIKKVKLVCQRGLNGPALLLPSTVLVPDDILSTMGKQQLDMAMCHELMHVKRKDPYVIYLLQLIKAVYWFNPIVWFALKLIYNDMETACDNTVVRHMELEEKRDYASALLSAFTRTKGEQMMLGMALGSNKKTAEKRIRGIFMINKTKKTVKATSLFVGAMIVLTCFTTACKPVSKMDAAVGGGQTYYDGVKRGEQANNNMGAFPKEWKKSYELKEGQINVDAKVSLPDTNQFPIVALKHYTYGQEDLDKIVKALVPGEKIYQDFGFMSTEEVEEIIQGIKSDIKRMEAGEKLEGQYSSIEEAKEHLTKWSGEELERSKPAAEITKIEWDGTFNGKGMNPEEVGCML